MDEGAQLSPLVTVSFPSSGGLGACVSSVKLQAQDPAEPYIPAGPGSNTWDLHENTTELPIFRELELGWFNAKGPSASPTESPEVPAPRPGCEA